MIENDRPDIAAIYDHYGLVITGRGHGDWVKAQCPLPAHDDRNPSASVNTDDNKWVCHACSEHGDSYDIIKEREGVTGWADIKRFAEKFSGGSNRPVREQRGGSSLLPRGKRRQSGSGAFVPTWRRFGTGDGT